MNEAARPFLGVKARRDGSNYQTLEMGGGSEGRGECLNSYVGNVTTTARTRDETSILNTLFFNHSIYFFVSTSPPPPSSFCRRQSSNYSPRSPPPPRMVM